MTKPPILLRRPAIIATSTAMSTAIACLLISLATPAAAQDSDSDSSYYYGGLSVGQSRAKLNDERMATDKFGPGVSLTIPLGTQFQFRAQPGEALTFLAVTMPPWPGAEEAFRVAGPWAASVES